VPFAPHPYLRVRRGYGFLWMPTSR